MHLHVHWLNYIPLETQFRRSHETNSLHFSLKIKFRFQIYSQISVPAFFERFLALSSSTQKRRLHLFSFFLTERETFGPVRWFTDFEAEAMSTMCFRHRRLFRYIFFSVLIDRARGEVAGRWVGLCRPGRPAARSLVIVARFDFVAGDPSRRSRTRPERTPIARLTRRQVDSSERNAGPSVGFVAGRDPLENVLGFVSFFSTGFVLIRFSFPEKRSRSWVLPSQIWCSLIRFHAIQQNTWKGRKNEI